VAQDPPPEVPPAPAAPRPGALGAPAAPTEEPRLTPAEEQALGRAREAYVAGRTAEALGLYDALVAAFPQRAVFWNDRGVTKDAIGNHGEAERDYRKALSLYPDYELAFRNLSNCLLFQGREDEALEALLAAVRLEPDYEGAYRDILAILLGRGPGRGEVEVAKRLARQARGPFSRFVYGVVAAEAGEGRTAVRELGEAAEALAKDEGLKARLGPEWRRVMGEFEKALGNALFARDEVADSVDAYRRSVEAHPEDEEAWNNLGFAYYTAGENELAIDCFKRAVEVAPGYKHAWYNLAYTYQAIDLLEEAIGAYDKTLECDPADEVAWNNRGNAEYNLGRYETSIPYFEKAVEVQPDYDIAWNNIGNALNKAGRHAEAIPFHERALKANPQFDYAWYALAKSRFHTGDLTGAVREVERCLAVNPQFDSGWAMKAEVLLHLGDLDEALEAAEQAVQANASNDHAHFVHGEVLEALGRPDAAEAAYSSAIALAGEAARIRGHVPDAWTALGEMLLARGHFEEARASFGKAAEIQPGSQLAREGTLDALIRLGRYRDAVLALRPEVAREAPHELLARMRLYLDTGEFAAVAPSAERFRKWYGDEPDARLLEGEALLALRRAAEARQAFARAAFTLEKRLSKERKARAKALEQSRRRRKRRERPKGAPPGGKNAAASGADEWQEVADGRSQIRALQEEGAFLDSFAEEPSGEGALQEQLYRARMLEGQAAQAAGGREDARALFLKATEARSDLPEAWFELGRLALEGGDPREARRAFERAVGADNSSELGWLGLARLSDERGRARAAERFRAAALRRAPGHPEGRAPAPAVKSPAKAASQR